METKKYFAKKGLTRNKAKKILKRKAADGMINAGQQAQPQGQPQGQPDPNAGQPQGQGLSVIVTMVANAPDGSQQPIGTVTIQKPDDLKQVIQKVIQVFQQGQQQPAQPGGEQQPAEQQPAQPQQPTQ